MSINYSIIIPHKNTPELLRRCLQSIPERDDTELLIIDDNSDPLIVDFDNFPGLNRKFVKVYFTKENKGAGYARNVGVKNAKGKWLLFADADDFFLEGFLSVIDSYQNSDADIIFYNSTSVYSDTLEPAVRHKDISNLIENYLNNKKDSQNKLRYMFYYPYSKMVKREMVISNNISFDEIKVSNDVWFAVQIGFFANKIIASKEAIYCVSVRSNSLSKSPGENIFDMRVKTNLKVDKFMRKIKIRNSHYPMFFFIIQARKYGLKKIISTTWLSLKNRSNIFLGVDKWVLSKVKSYL